EYSPALFFLCPKTKLRLFISIFHCIPCKLVKKIYQPSFITVYLDSPAFYKDLKFMVHKKIRLISHRCSDCFLKTYLLIPHIIFRTLQLTSCKNILKQDLQPGNAA